MKFKIYSPARDRHRQTHTPKGRERSSLPAMWANLLGDRKRIIRWRIRQTTDKRWRDETKQKQ